MPNCWQMPYRVWSRRWGETQSRQHHLPSCHHKSSVVNLLPSSCCSRGDQSSHKSHFHHSVQGLLAAEGEGDRGLDKYLTNNGKQRLYQRKQYKHSSIIQGRYWCTLMYVLLKFLSCLQFQYQTASIRMLLVRWCRMIFLHKYLGGLLKFFDISRGCNAPPR